MSASTFVLVFVTLAMLPVGIGLYRYATSRVRRAEELRALGWTCIGYDFLTGPIMSPPWLPAPVSHYFAGIERFKQRRGHWVRVGTRRPGVAIARPGQLVMIPRPPRQVLRWVWP